MVDHARFAFRPRCLAVHAGIGGPAGRGTEREIAGIFVNRERSASTKWTVVPAKAGIQYAVALRSTIGALQYWAARSSQAVTMCLLRPVEELQRVDRRRAFADLEVQLRRSDLARLAGLGNDLAALDGVATLHQQFTRMGIGGDVTVGVPNQNQVAVALELIARIGNDAILGSLHRRAFGHRQVDAVIGLAIGL